MNKRNWVESLLLVLKAFITSSATKIALKREHRRRRSFQAADTASLFSLRLVSLSGNRIGHGSTPYRLHCCIPCFPEPQRLSSSLGRVSPKEAQVVESRSTHYHLRCCTLCFPELRHLSSLRPVSLSWSDSKLWQHLLPPPLLYPLLPRTSNTGEIGPTSGVETGVGAAVTTTADINVVKRKKSRASILKFACLSKSKGEGFRS